MESKLLHTSIGVNENTDVWDYHMVPFLEEFTYLGSQVSQLTQSRICSLRYDTIYDLVKKHKIYTYLVVCFKTLILNQIQFQFQS